MKTQKLFITAACCLLLAACGKKDAADNDVLISVPADVNQKVETVNGITYRVFTAQSNNSYKGILVMGSGNDEASPSVGSLDGSQETALCVKAAQGGYIAAIVQYRKTAGTADWNSSAQQIATDYDQCIVALSTKYGVDKARSVVGGESYSSYMLLTDIAVNTTLSYCKGVLAPCGATGLWQAQHFKIPIYNIVCSGNNEGDLSGKPLYDAITDPDIKSKSEGVTDNSCNTHCGGSWNDRLYAKMVNWLQ